MFSAAMAISSNSGSGAWAMAGGEGAQAYAGAGAPPLGAPPVGGQGIGAEGGASMRVLQQTISTTVCMCGPSGCNCNKPDLGSIGFPPTSLALPPLGSSSFPSVSPSSQLIDQLQQNTQSQQLNSMVNLLVGLLQNSGGAEKAGGKHKKKKGHHGGGHDKGGAKATAGADGASAMA